MMQARAPATRAPRDHRGSLSTPRTTRRRRAPGRADACARRVDADHAQHGDADHLPGATHAQGEAIEVDVDHVEVRERTRPPCLQAVLQRGDDARHGTLGERGRLEQRLERAANPAGVAACQVRSDHGFIDLRHSPLIARDDARRPFFRVAGAAEEGSPRQRECDRAGRSRERPLSHAIAVAPSNVTALVGTRPERGPQLLVDGRLDRSADVLVDQFAERDGLKLLRPRFFLDTLAHGVFLRWPPCKAARWSCTSPTGRMRHFSFPPDSGHDPWTS